MLCPNARYNEIGRLECTSKEKLENDKVFRERCPLVYWCGVRNRFENTANFVQCMFYKGDENERK